MSGQKLSSRWGEENERQSSSIQPGWGISHPHRAITLPTRQSQWKSTFPAGKPHLCIPIRVDPPALLLVSELIPLYAIGFPSQQESAQRAPASPALVALRWRVHCPLLHINMSIWHLFPRSLPPALKRGLSHLQVWSGVKEDVEAKWHGCHLRWASCSWHVYTQQWCPACSSQCPGTGVGAEHRGSDNNRMLSPKAGKA